MAGERERREQEKRKSVCVCVREREREREIKIEGKPHSSLMTCKGTLSTITLVFY